jgi:hypothetical protein
MMGRNGDGGMGRKTNSELGMRSAGYRTLSRIINAESMA